MTSLEFTTRETLAAVKRLDADAARYWAVQTMRRARAAFTDDTPRSAEEDRVAKKQTHPGCVTPGKFACVYHKTGGHWSAVCGPDAYGLKAAPEGWAKIEGGYEN